MTRQSTYLLLFVALSFIGGTVQGEGNWQVVNAANPPSARIGHGMATLPDGRVVLFGGEDDAQNMYNDLFSYESEQWSPVTATDFTPAQRRNQVVWFHDGALYIHGGVAKNHEMLEDLWAFDLAKQKWEEMQTGTTKPFARYGHVATPLPDGGVVFSGGTDVAGFALKDTWKLNPDMTYTLLGFSPHPMSNHVAQVIDNVLYTFPEPGKIDTL
ncbi:MAG TPA: kelch repeat-containing protein, partial [bacterium]|nr:kelch repeat-containing protein [bacterium]